MVSILSRIANRSEHLRAAAGALSEGERRDCLAQSRRLCLSLLTSVDVRDAAALVLELAAFSAAHRLPPAFLAFVRGPERLEIVGGADVAMTDLECVRRRDEPTIARALIHAEATNDGRARIVRENLIPRPEAHRVQAAPHG